jgi:acyl-CoA synthetase (AMP-forming)/AMP-acid ligase II
VRARLAAYKIPKRIVFVGELPCNAIGKVQKQALRAQYRSLYQFDRSCAAQKRNGTVAFH